MSTELISRRYGSALADVVLKTGETETVKAELAVFEQMVFGSQDLTNALTNPAITHSGKERVLEELLKRTKPSRTTANFLRVLLQNNRLAELAEINDRFESELEHRSGIVSAEVTSAHEMQDDEKAEFESTIQKLTGKRVNIEYAVDPELIGGAVTRIGSTVYDGSVRTKLQNLREQLSGA